MLLNVQALRALAAFMVVGIHLEPLIAGVDPRSISTGAAGVDLFFVISGFIMVHTTTDRASPVSFMRNRIIRIAPIYWLATLGLFGLALAAPGLMDATRADAGELLLSLLFIPFEKQGAIQPLLFLGWTLNYEMFFYAMFAVSLLLDGPIRRVAITSVLLAGLVVLGGIISSDAAAWRFYTDPIVLEFALGMAIGLVGERVRLGVGALLVGLLLIAVANFAWPGLHRAVKYGVPAALVLLAALNLERCGRVIRSSFILSLGNASYAIYLTHAFVLLGLAKVAGANHPWVTVPIGLVAVTAAGMGVHKLIEVPMQQRLRRMDWRPRRAAHQV